MTALGELDAAGDELALRVHRQTYQDPFWLARFGERGERFSREDARHHVNYLAAALRAEAPSVLRDYARWLQSVLTSRGMCSEHLRENFARLTHHIESMRLSCAGDARAYLEQAQDALRYGSADAPRAPTAAAAHAIQEASAGLIDSILAGAPSRGGAGRPRARGELTYVVSYMADAIFRGDDGLFLGHVTWTRNFLKIDEFSGVYEYFLDALANCESVPDVARLARQSRIERVSA